MPPSVLLIGLPWESIPDADLRQKIRLDLERVEQDMTSAGYDYKGFFGHPDTGGLQPFTDILKSRKWDVVIVGFGVRGNPNHTVFFEWLVNEIRERVPEAKLGFNWEPGNTIDSA